MLGLDKLTNAFGLLILFRGAAAIIGSPLAGAVYDATNSYDIPFFMAAAFFAVSALTSFMAPALTRSVFFVCDKTVICSTQTSGSDSEFLSTHLIIFVLSFLSFADVQNRTAYLLRWLN